MTYQRIRSWRISAIALFLLPMATCASDPNSGSSRGESTTSPTEQLTREQSPDSMETYEEYTPEPPDPRASDLEAWYLVGRYLETDQELAAYMTSNGCQPGLGFNWVCSNGAEFHMNTDHQVEAAFMSPSYQGATPENISFEETPEDLIARLGEPNETDGSTTFSWWYEGGFALVVNYPGLAEQETAGYPLSYQMNRIKVQLL